MTEAKKARCFDKNWRYTRSEATDLHALFRKVRRELKEAAKAPPANVKPIRKKEQKNG